jgi:protein-disulfide isomerase
MTKAKRTQHHIPGLEITSRDHIQGPADAPVTLMEYGDYQCPYCGEAYYVIKQLQKRVGDGMRFVFRNFPLNSVHPYAEGAAEAAEAACGQGKFWEMHDTLYEHQDELRPEQLLDHAKRLWLDLARFTDDLTNRVYAERVREDFMSGVRGGVNGTPTFFINGVRFDSSYDFEPLLQAIEPHLKKRAA